MREHQITITLQAEQFQEIQRLARTAGARSVGTYAREKLLAAVGLNLGSKNLRANRAQDLTSVTGELKRLQRELQIFIAESLSAKDYGYIVNEQPQTEQPDSTIISTITSDSNQELFSLENPPTRPLLDYQQSAKEAEDLAERAFIISPRLGAIEEVSDEPMDFFDPLDELLGEDDGSTTSLTASSLLKALGNEQQTEDKENVPAGEIPHSVFDAELVAFQNQQQHQQIQNQLTETATEETREDTASPVSTNTAPTGEEEGGGQPTVDQTKPDENVNSGAQAGIQEEGSEIDFQNRPPLSGGPPPRKRRT